MALITLIGGIGTIYGPLLGALFVVVLENFLRAELGGSIPGGNLIVLGFVLIGTAMFLRRGIFGALASLFERLRGRPA